MATLSITLVSIHSEAFSPITSFASMPVVSKPVEINGKKYLDGGISDPIPYRIMEQLGYDRMVVILTQPKDYKKKKSAALPLMQILLGRYPKTVHAMKRRHLIYNAQTEEIKRLEKEGKILVIRPEKPLGIKRTEGDPVKLEKVYQLGRTAGTKQYCAYLAGCHDYGGRLQFFKAQ